MVPNLQRHPNLECAHLDTSFVNGKVSVMVRYFNYLSFTVFSCHRKMTCRIYGIPVLLIVDLHIGVRERLHLGDR